MKFCSPLIAIVLLLGNPRGFSQSFANLDFESADLSGYPIGSVVPTANAFPGWTVNAGSILYDTVTLSGGSISLMDSNSATFWEPTTPIQGNYFVLFENVFASPSGSEPVSIGQTGMIPRSAKSLTFWGDDEGLQITFNGQPLAFEAMGATADYSIYGADISEYAGQTGELLFTAPPFTGGDALDNIQFSRSEIPEPGEFALAVIGGLMLAGQRWRKSSR
jgi:hypothetical protein